MSYSIEKNKLSKFQKKFNGPNKLKNENKANNFTINNNFYTNNIINNYNNNKNNDNKLSIHKFNFNISCNINKKKLQIFKNSFQISRLEKYNFKNISANNLNVLKNGIKNINNKNINNKNNDFRFSKNIKSQNNLNFTKAVNEISNKKSESYSSSCSSISYESDSNNDNNNNDENIFECENQAKKPDTLKNVKTLKSILKNKKNIVSININENKSKVLTMKQIIKINIKPSYLNLNEITEGKFAKSKGLQDCIKKIVIKKILKHKNVSQSPKKRKTLGGNKKNLQTLRKVPSLIMSKKQILSPNRRKSVCVTKQLNQNLQNHRFVTYKKEAQTPKIGSIQSSNKFIKDGIITRNMTKRDSNYFKINTNTNNDKSKKLEVKSKFNMMADIQENSLEINENQENNQIIESNNSSDLTPKKRKNNDEFLLDYVNRNIKDDKDVLNNPDKFYNGLFGAIMKKVNQNKMKKSDEEK